MSNSTNIRGYHSPIILLKDGNGKNIFDVNHNVQVVKFKYKFDEENDDECEIHIRTQDRSLPDNPNFFEGAILIVSWGYINNLSESRKIAVRDSKCRYGNDEIRLELYCSDLASFLKTTKQNLEGDSMKDYLDKISDQGLNVEFKVDTEFIYDSGKRVGTFETEDLTYKTAVDVSAVAKWLEIPILIEDANLNPITSIKKQLQEAPLGPYVVDTRDDKITIKNRYFKKKPIKAYNYQNEPGDLYSFNPYSDNKNMDTKRILSAYSDYEEDEVGSFDFALNRSKETGEDEKYPQFGNSNTYGSFRRQKDDWLRITAKIIEENKSIELNNYKLIKEGKEPLPLKEIPPFTLTDTDQSIGYTDTDDLFYKTAVESTAYLKNYKLQASAVLLSPLEKERLKEFMTNEGKEREQKRNMADMTVIGDPVIKVSEIIKIGGVAKRYSGLHYILNTTHEIAEQGYKVDMELLNIEEIIGKKRIANSTSSSNQDSDTSEDKEVDDMIQLTDEEWQELVRIARDDEVNEQSETEVELQNLPVYNAKTDGQESN